LIPVGEHVPTTRALNLSETPLLALPGCAIYDVSGPTPTSLQDYNPSDLRLVFYEVSEASEQGSWWLATAAADLVPPDWAALGGSEPLDASQTIPTRADSGMAILRPSKLLTWVPAASLATSGFAPRRVTGRVRGSFPATPPGD